MEAQPDTCDFYRSDKPCCDFTVTPELMVEQSVREAIVAVLGKCSIRGAAPCRAVDLGANNGWMSMFMLALGANVTSVEPASDFAQAIADSARLNCWSDRHRSINAFACAFDDSRTHRRCMRPRRPWNGYRAGGGGRGGLRDRLRDAHGVTLRQILTPEGARAEREEGRNGPVLYDLLKLDGDGPEGTWMEVIDSLLAEGRIGVDAILLEANNVDDRVMFRFQSLHGFHVYRLDEADYRRHLNADGWDDFSPRGTFAPLTRRAAAAAIGRGTAPSGAHESGAHAPGGGAGSTPLSWARDALETEAFGLRGIRHLWRVKPNATVAEWNVVLSPIRSYDNASGHSHLTGKAGSGHQWLLTSEELSEPVLPLPSGARWSASKWRASRGLD